MGQADEEAHSQEAVGAALPPVAALVERFQQRLGTYLLHLVGDLDHALVLAEQTFVRAHFAGLASGPELSAQVWLYERRMVTNGNLILSLFSFGP